MDLKPLEELFGIADQEVKDDGAGGDFQIKKLPLNKTIGFLNHPFKVEMDAAMAELVESVRKHGVLHPGIARPAQDGDYEVIAGHRRRYACELAGLEEMPFIVRNYSDDEATVIMVESNIQRPNISLKEKAFAYRMHMEAQKRLNALKKRERVEGDAKLVRSDEILAKKTGESRNTIQRYIRLTYLLPELLELADAGKLSFIPATELSYLKIEEQELLLHYIQVEKVIPSGQQALALKACSARKTLIEADIKRILTRVQAPASKVVFGRDTLSKFFPKNYKQKQMEDVILVLLQEWAKKQRNNIQDQIPGQEDITTLEGGRYMP